RRHKRGGAAAYHPCGALGMIPSGVKVFLASQPVDFRKGPDSLLSLVRDAGSDPFSGALYIFRAKRPDRLSFYIPTARSADRVSVASTFRPDSSRP
ncbi:IS66 family insertion sequence element accessory protein TnpB, partial [Cereibacter changlensis]